MAFKLNSSYAPAGDQPAAITDLTEGIVNGEIIAERKGIKGFGYDSVFLPDGNEQTFAEMPLEQKNKISHRARAVCKLVDFLDQRK